MERWAVVVAGLAVLRAVVGLLPRRSRRRVRVRGGLAASTGRGWVVREPDRLVLVVRTARWAVPLDPPPGLQARRELRRLVPQLSGEVLTARTVALVFADARGRTVLLAPTAQDGALEPLRSGPAGGTARWSSCRPWWLVAATLALPGAWLATAATATGGGVVALGVAAHAVLAADLALGAVWRRRPATPVTPVLLRDPSLRGPWTDDRLEALDVVALLRLLARTEGRTSMEQEGLRARLRGARSRRRGDIPPAPLVLLTVLAILTAGVQPVVARSILAVLTALAAVWVVLEVAAARARTTRRRRTAPSTWGTLSEPGTEPVGPTRLWLLDGDRTPWVVDVKQPLPPDAVVDVFGELVAAAPVEVRWEGEWQATTGRLRATTLGDVDRARTSVARALRLCWPEQRR